MSTTWLSRTLAVAYVWRTIPQLKGVPKPDNLLEWVRTGLVDVPANISVLADQLAEQREQPLAELEMLARDRLEPETAQLVLALVREVRKAAR